MLLIKMSDPLMITKGPATSHYNTTCTIDVHSLVRQNSLRRLDLLRQIMLSHLESAIEVHVERQSEVIAEKLTMLVDHFHSQ